MKTSIPFVFTYLFCISMNICAQNLIPNPSFELANRMPEKKGNSINRANYWIAPKAYSDYYYKGSGKGRSCGTPKNIFGRQTPHTGDAYAGICIRKKYVEYIETKLIVPLTKDKEYRIEFYISKAERTLGSVKEFGVLFTNKNIWGVTTRGIEEKPQVNFINPKGYKDKKNWTKLSAVYKAEGGETVIIIGHFDYKLSEGKCIVFDHYYIDDVSLTPINEKTDSVVTNEVTDSIPKIYSPKIGETVRLKNIFFTTNNSELLTASFIELDRLVQFLSKSKNINTTILISGHTDNTGNEDQNITLSEARAQSVADYLVLKGINKLRINYNGYGSSNPVTTNDTNEGKQQNRRVEFIINKN
ncbi:OmpA family protein [Brumimicrobium glaciale]|uniref:OmpA family protein n=1 Tax=Brumimicrobium glaciale TaxID=200475 RepID=A0A4Q4KFV2_9FLAO|nr:OmpA family protein [Brumimicrobium glaciale]RYM31417.1 OmpA family protein [Brumimicrobium glaciale]